MKSSVSPSARGCGIDKTSGMARLYPRRNPYPGRPNVTVFPYVQLRCSVARGRARHADESRQSRNKRDSVVAFGADLPSRGSRMLLRMLRRELLAALQHATPSWVSTSRTGRAIRKRQCCIRSSRNI
jgi:hypothetical protein